LAAVSISSETGIITVCIIFSPYSLVWHKIGDSGRAALSSLLSAYWSQPVPGTRAVPLNN
jgi:hypothetical protein